MQKQYIFVRKGLQGGILDVLGQIKKEFEEIKKHLGFPMEEATKKQIELKQEEQALAIKLRKTKDDAAKICMEEIREQLKRIRCALLVQQKVEELTNRATLRKDEEIKEDIDVYECQQVEEEDEDPQTQGEKESSLSAIHQQCIDFMKFAEPMPECFEKSLVRICYFLQALENSQNSDNSNQVSDGILKIVTKEDILKNLDQDLSTIMDKFEAEKIDNTKVELQMTQSIASLKDIKYNQQQPPEFFNKQLGRMLPLFSNVRPFNLQEFFKLYDVCDKNSHLVEKKDIILLLGTTGAGKSTTIQYLYGANMVKIGDHIQGKRMPKKLKTFVSSAAMKSETRYINTIEISFTRSDGKVVNIILVDTPGFGDTQSIEVDIANSLGIIKAIQNAGKVYPVFLFNQKNMGQKSDLMKETIEFYSCMVKNLESNMISMNFFFSHFSNFDKNMEQFLQDINKDLNLQEQSKLNLNMILKHMERLGKENKLLILDPLNKDKRQKVIDQILNTPPINNPKREFTLNICEKSKNYLDKQVSLQEKYILEAVYQGQTDQASYKLEEIKKLASIFMHYDMQYNNRLQQINLQIKSIVRKKLDTVMDRIQTCMKPGNQMYDTDIAKFQDALAFEKKISPLLTNTQVPRQGTQKVGQQVQCDQQQEQSTIITDIVSQSSNILAQLEHDYEVSEDEWIQFIKKAMTLSRKIIGFDHLKENALNKFDAKFYKLSKVAKDILKQSSIDQFEPQEMEASESSNDENKQKPQHEQFGQALTILYQGLKKIKQITDIEKFVCNLEKYIFEILQKVPRLSDRVKEHFQFDQHEDGLNYQILTPEKIKKIKKSLIMLEKFCITCKPIDAEFQRAIEQVYIQYITKCEALFEIHQQFFENLQNDLNPHQSYEVKQRFHQIELLRQIKQIEHKTNGPYYQLNNQLKNQVSFSKTEIVSINDKLNEYASQEGGNMQGLNQLFKRLKEALISLKTLGEASTESSSFMNKVNNDIKESFETLIDKLNQDASQYLELRPEKFKNLRPLASIYEQVVTIYDLSEIIKVSIKPDVGKEWLEAIKSTVLLIEKECLNFSKKLMNQSDYRSLDHYYNYMKQICSIQQFSAMRIVQQHLNELLRNETRDVPLRVDSNFMGLIEVALLSQREFKEKEFKKASEKFCELTEANEITALIANEEVKTGGNIMQNSYREVERQLIECSEIIKTLFKLEKDTNHYYRFDYYQKYFEMIDSDQNYFLSLYTTQLEDSFFDELQRNFIVNQKGHQWKYLKLTALKYLKGIDSYLLRNPNGQMVQGLYDGLYDKVYHDPPQEVNKALNNFKEKNYSDIKKQCEDLSQPPISQNSENILSRIKDLLSNQATREYEQMQRHMSYDNKVKKEEAENIARQCRLLMEINIHLGPYIIISGKSIKEMIDGVLTFLGDCFTTLQKKVVENLLKNNFLQSTQLIKESKELFRSINQEIGIDIQQLQNYQYINTINSITQEKINGLLTKIDQIFEEFLSDKSASDMSTTKFIISPRVICENLSKIEKNEEINQKLGRFYQDLRNKYNHLKNQITEELIQTQDIQVIYTIEQKVQKLKESLIYLPVVINNEMSLILNNLISPYLEQIQIQQNRAIQEMKNAISQNQCPLIISQVLQQKQKIIQKDQSGELKTFIEREITNKFSANIITANSKIERLLVQEVISDQITALGKYMYSPLIQDFIQSQAKQDYFRILSRIGSLFNASLKEYAKYFSETHTIRGEKIFNGGVEKDLQTRQNHFKVLQGVLASYQNHKDIVERDCVPNLQQTLYKFLSPACDYLRKMRIQHQNSLENKVASENVAAINNIRYTSEILTQEFTRLFSEMQDDVCQQKCKEFVNELEKSSLNAMQNATNEWLKRESKEITNKDFTDQARSEANRITFYKQVQFVLNLITLAQKTELMSIIRNQDSSKITLLFEEYQKHCNENINNIVIKVRKFNQRINVNEQITQDEQDQFATLYRSLKSMSQVLSMQKTLIENAIEDVEGALNQKLQKLKKEAKQYYGKQETLNLLDLSMILCEIQSMKENLILFGEQIDKIMNQILDDYQLVTAKIKTSIADLQSTLRGIPGSQGSTLAQKHPFFKSINTLVANKSFLSKKIDVVLSEIQGTDLDEGNKNELEEFYKEFWQIYQIVVDETLIPRYDDQKQKKPLDLTSIRANIKNVFSSDRSRKWTVNEIFDTIECGMDKPKSKMSILLAYIFALWTLMNADDYKKQQEKDANQVDLKGFLFQPHVAQVLSILRMMGVGYANKYKGGQNFSKDWAKVFGTNGYDISCIRNNLVQIKTGEGKSVVLAVVSIIFALYGFEVNCACYSKYLSTRDYESFYPLFQALSLQDLITYGTFNEIAEKRINKDGDVREIISSFVLKDEYYHDKPVLKAGGEKRPQVLLIDEVDVFFSDSFYGRIYIPQALIKHEHISALTDYIWQRRQEKIEEEQKVSSDQKSQYPYLSLKELKETQVYKDALSLFNPDYKFLVEEAAKKMIIDVVEYQSPDHLYVIHQGEIGYENQDQISTNATIGYQTLFAYYHKNKLGEIKDDVFLSKKAIGLNCASFSYAEVPLEYDIILGVTGTLETLSEPQKDIINNVYSIHHNTLSPSVHSSDQQRIFNPNSGVIIIKNPSEYYMKLINDMESFYLSNNRPIILFFENNKALEQFVNSENFKEKKYSYQVLNERDTNQEKAMKVLKATQARQITLSTKNFGRGTDFCCYDQKVIEKGGLVVIQTFLSEDLSEETQIRGRTGRQGTNGTFMMYLNSPDLSKFNIELSDIESWGDDKIYKSLCEFRDRKLAREQHETTKNREALQILHKRSIKMIKEVKQIIMINDPSETYTGEEEKKVEEELKEGDEKVDLTQLNAYLLEMNKGITLESESQFMKVLVLIDCTSSMGITLQKTKNCVRAMFDEAKSTLKSMNLDEDLILMKIGGYRNYNSVEQEIFQVSPEWTSNPTNLAEFLNNSLKVHGGWGNEAMEIGLQYANKEIQNNQGIPLSMVIVIGDAPPNTFKDVESKRYHAANVLRMDKKYWEKSQNYRVSTNWEKELSQIKEAGVPVHSFYVLNEKLKEAEVASQKALLKTEFSKLAVNDGKCSFLDIHDEKVGQQQLKDFFKYLIVYRATEINLGKEEALKSVKGIDVAFT